MKSVVLNFGILLVASPLVHAWTFNDLKSQQVSSDTNLVWKQVAPGMAGSNRGIYADSVDPNKVWVSPDMGHDYLTVDGGKHWESVIPPDGPWTGRQSLSDTCVRSDPKDPSVVVSLVYNGWWANPRQQIDVSTDGGYTFNPISSYASGSEPNSLWFCATPHPTEAGTWYVCNGNDFKEVRTGVDPNPVSSYVDTSISKVWKITDITSASRTIFPVSNTGMDADTSVFDLICHPDSATYPDMLFAATSTGLYRKDDSSSAWVRILDGCCKADSHWDGFDLTLYVLQQATYTDIGNAISSSGGVFISTAPETAATSSGWIDKTAGLLVDLSQLTIQPAGLYPTFIQTWFGYADPAGDSFAKPASFFPNFDEIRVDPTNTDRIYLSNVTRGNFYTVVTGPVWATLDGGDNWFAAARLGNGFEQESYWTTKQPGRTTRNIPEQVFHNAYPDFWNYDNRGCRSMTMAADGTVYASINKGYYTVKYDADTDQWTSIDNTQIGDVYYGHGNCDVGGFGVYPDIHRKGEMYLLQQEASVWKTVSTRHPDFPGTIGAYELPGLQDEGPSWAPGIPYLVPTALAQHPSNTNVFYFLSPRTGDFMKSNDNGLSYEILSEPVHAPGSTTLEDCVFWRNMRIAPGAAAIYVVSEVVDDDNVPMGRVSIYNPNSKKGVYKSTDEGLTWSDMNTGLPVCAAGRDDNVVGGTNSACVKAMVMAPENPDVLYVAVKRYYALGGGYVNGGLYRTGNGASSWSAEDIPAGIKSLWDVWLDEDAGAVTKIYIAGGGDGDEADWGEGGVWVADYKTGGGYVSSDWNKIFDHPFCSHVSTSPFDGDRILVATRETSSIDDLNSGIYLTFTGGNAGDGSDWRKLNMGRGPIRTSTVLFDTANPDRIWSSGESSGSCSMDLVPALDIIPLPIDHHSIANSEVMLSFDDGPTNRWFVLESKTNLQDAAWTVRQVGLPVSGTGYGAVTNLMSGTQEFYRLIQRVVPIVEVSADIDFLAPDYNDGNIDNHAAWSSSSGTWTVDATAGTVSCNSANDNMTYLLGSALSVGQTLEFTVKYNVLGIHAPPTDSKWKYVSRLGVTTSNTGDNVGYDAAGTSLTEAMFTIQSHPSITNAFRAYGDGWAPGPVGTLLDANDSMDEYAVHYSITLGASPLSTTFSVELENVTKSISAGVISETDGIGADLYNALVSGTAYPYFETGSLGDGITGVQVNSVSISVTD